MMARVLAALRSRFASSVSRVLRVEAVVVVVVVVAVEDVVVVVTVAVTVVVDVAGTAAAEGWWLGFAPLYEDVFSGETDEWSGVERVIVKAVDSSLGL